MQYEQALALWGARRLEAIYNSNSRRRLITIEPSSVYVGLDFNKGFACCSGRDPLCYCSYAESPSANVSIRGWDSTGETYSAEIDADSFDFVKFLSELVEVGGGIVQQ